MPAPKGNQYAKGNKGGLGFKPIYKPEFAEQAKKSVTRIPMLNLPISLVYLQILFICGRRNIKTSEWP